MSGVATATWLNKIAKEKSTMMQEFFDMEPLHVPVKDPKTKQPRPRCQGEDLVYLWDKIYAADQRMTDMVVETVTGPSTPGKDYYDDINANPVFPYQQLRALVGDGGKWKWPEIYKNLDLLPRRGPAWRHMDDPSNLGAIENPNPHIVPLNCLVVGGGPVGCRLAIELALGGHRVTLWEKRREIVDPKSGLFERVGFTNRVNRPHINNFCRNDLDRLNGRNFMTPKMCYPVFTNAHTSSIGIDECQMLLMKTALLLGVDFQLGIGYENASIDVDEANSRPRWLVDYTADERAQQRHGVEASGEKLFDALFGCDGGQSRVRATQQEWLGEPKTRQYKKMFGIVSNLRKVSKSKLKEMGFETGLEPEDRAGGKTGIFFYKASYHNYFIVHPSAEEMEANNIPWEGVFSFHKASGEANKKKEDLKNVLKTYMTKKAQELNIPIDPTLDNDGFVAAPNDVMGFDFSQFYNCEKSAAAFVPPLEWNVEEDGEWEIHCPLVALAGDAVADPNWLLGVGLQRGWNSALDATFYADNLYNNKTFNGKPPDKDEPITEPIEWSAHLDNLMNLIQELGNAARDSKMSEEMDTGMLDEKGPVVVQIRRKMAGTKSEAPVPQYLPQVEPWPRYKTFELAVKRPYKGKDLYENVHPLAVRELAIFEKNSKWVDQGDMIKKKVTRPTAAMLTWPKRFECSAFWGMMKLLYIDGKAAPGVKPLEPGASGIPTATPTAAPAKAAAPAPAPEPEPEPEPELAPPEEVKHPAFDPEEVKQKAQRKSLRLHQHIVEAALAGPIAEGVTDKSNKGLENLIFGSARKMSQRKLVHTIGEPIRMGAVSPAPAPAPDIPAPADRFKRPSMISNEDMSAIAKLSQQLALGGGATGGEDPMHQAKILAAQYEQQTLKAKLAFAEIEVARVEHEHKAAEAKLSYVRKEVEMITKMMKAYAEAEAKLKSM